MPKIQSHLQYAKNLEETTKSLSSIQGAVLKYKQKIDETGNIINTISNSFFNIQNNWAEKTEDEIKGMQNLSKEDIIAKIENTKKIKNQIVQIKSDIEDDTTIIPAIKSLLLRKIEKLIKNIEIIELSTPLEAEKYCYTLRLTKKWISIKSNKAKAKQLWLPTIFGDYDDNIKRIEALQSTIYWPRISDTPEEKNEIVSILDGMFKKSKEKLSSHEIIIFQNFLDAFKDARVPMSFTASKKIEMKGNLPMTSIKNISDYTIQKFFDLPDRWSKIKAGQTNLWVGFQNQELKLPSDKKSLWESSLATISEHEIGWHIVRGAKSKQRLWFASDNYENIEEWMTTLNEYFLHYDTIEDIPIKPEIPHISTFIWENYDFKDTFELLKIYYKLSGKEDKEAWKMALVRTKRVKWYYARDKPGANRKDVIYYRGVKKLIDYLKTLSPQQKAEFYNDAYFSKLSFEDIAFVPDLREQLNISPATTDIPYPLYKLIARKEKYKNPKTESKTGAFLKEQDKKENLTGEDFRFLKLEPLNREKRKQVINIMQYKEESKEYDNLKKDLEQINSLLRKWGEIVSPENLFTSEITKKLFIKRRNMERKEITDKKTLKSEEKSRWTFAMHEILQKIWDEIESVLTRKLQ